MFDLAVLRDFVLTIRIAPPTINISVVGYYKGIERHSCPMASVKKSVTQCILDKAKAYERICAAESIRYWAIDANEHEEGAFGEHFDRLFRSQVLSDKVLTPVPGDIFEKCFRGWKT